VLARRRGSVFLRDAEPLAIASLDGPMLDLWAPLAGGRDHVASRDQRARARAVFDAFPVTQPAFRRLLALLDVEASDAVPPPR